MCLDFLHHGHVNILKNAAKYGSIILGLITDKGIKGYKKKNQLIILKIEKYRTATKRCKIYYTCYQPSKICSFSKI